MRTRHISLKYHINRRGLFSRIVVKKMRQHQLRRPVSMVCRTFHENFSAWKWYSHFLNANWWKLQHACLFLSRIANVSLMCWKNRFSSWMLSASSPALSASSSSSDRFLTSGWIARAENQSSDWKRSPKMQNPDSPAGPSEMAKPFLCWERPEIEKKLRASDSAAVSSQ